jgi:glycosyltransferase involved in cell wall biosynthesis
MPLNLQSLGTALHELLPHNNAIPRLSYHWKFARQKMRNAAGADGFTLVVATRNRKEFLACAVDAVLANTQLPFELFIMDNASEDGTDEMCRSLQRQHPDRLRHFRLDRNFGTNAYALGFLHARFKYLVDMDDDILALSRDWDRAAVNAFERFPRLGFLAMNVVQDEYTTGAKKQSSLYAEQSSGDTTLQVGPTGGWFSVTTRARYNEVGGFVFKPYKPFPPEDGKYIRRLSRHDYFAAILKHKFVYHASGAYWNSAYGYTKIWDEKYRRDHRDHLRLIKEVRIGEVPTADYARRMVLEAERASAGRPSAGASG